MANTAAKRPRGARRRAASPDDVVRLLATAYPARCELDHAGPWQLLVATVLSAQCTDATVNRITPALFARWPGAAELAAADQPELENAIHSAGFFRSKARALKATARQVVAEHGGEVPGDLASLVRLPGVGRKTAKVVLGVGFGVAAGIAVDTHVGRVSRRLGLTRREDPEKVAAELEALVPREEWVGFSLRMVLHGRYTCTARAPRCNACALAGVCPRLGVKAPRPTTP